MSDDWVHGLSLFWFSDLSTKAKPACWSYQLFSITLPSTSMRLTCLTSIRFFAAHTPFHDAGRMMWFPRIVTSDGDRFWIVAEPPPNRMISAPASRWLFWMRKGPGPFHPASACESFRLLWHSPSQESRTADVALLSATQRLS